MRVECDPTTNGGQQSWDKWWFPRDDMLPGWAAICPTVSGGMVQCLGSPGDQFWLDQKGYHTHLLVVLEAIYIWRLSAQDARETYRPMRKPMSVLTNVLSVLSARRVNRISVPIVVANLFVGLDGIILPEVRKPEMKMKRSKSETGRA